MPTFKYERMELKKRFRGGKKSSFINALVKLRLSKHVLFVYSSNIKIVGISLHSKIGAKIDQWKAI